MFNAAISGELPNENYEPDISVVVQQIFSFLYQNPNGVDEESILELLSLLCSEKSSKLILSELKNKGWIEYQHTQFFASTKLSDLGQKGRIHSNIPDPQSYRVIDIASGIGIGKISGTPDEVFMLGGRVWHVIIVEKNVIKAQLIRGKIASPSFQRHKGQGACH
ncbi:hypothetical protein SE15_13910 [Thermanaerothrix daxensis]|uniref:Uncharacterized protein n=1 Tax=Thermanaerothrix daxensis TaxID=869279 RepID=A0A0P6YIJ0_9CHLR|nr:hypothetical protein [Thermanaerothrix daxensis]KPL82169.1 hypothetical protein SE15_13910 [Thermanaerothrix daxensis]